MEARTWPDGLPILLAIFSMPESRKSTSDAARDTALHQRCLRRLCNGQSGGTVPFDRSDRDAPSYRRAFLGATVSHSFAARAHAGQAATPQLGRHSAPI